MLLLGGAGLKNTLDYFTQTMKLPWILSVIIIFIECFGSVGLIAGAFSRVCAAGLIVIMVGAIGTTNHKHGLL